MKTLKPKLALFALLLISLLFFSNDFGLIDIEKTAIITAIAVDKSQDGEYEVTCQIAVPEASNAVSENQKAQMVGKGSTIGNAIKTMGSLSGWFPQTIFCNLIILGNEILDDDVINVLDYFHKTMRVQDSAQIVLAEKKAKELLNSSTPLDNISSFAIQKILLKNPGFDQDVYAVDIKTFCVGYYGRSKTSLLPIIKTIPTEKENQQNQEESSSTTQQSDTKTSGKTAFDATNTALFLNGKKVGEFDKKLTNTLNMLTKKVNGSAFAVNDVDGVNYLLTIKRDKSKIKLSADENNLNLDISIKLYCLISDQTSTLQEGVFMNSDIIPDKVKRTTENMIKQNVLELLSTVKQTRADVLNLKEKLYRFCNKQYSRYKDNYLDVMKVNVNVEVYGQE